MFSFMVFIVNWYLFNSIHIFTLVLFIIVKNAGLKMTKTFLNSPSSEVPLGGHQPLSVFPQCWFLNSHLSACEGGF